MAESNSKIGIFSIVISVFALFISGLVAYYNLFHYERKFHAWVLNMESNYAKSTITVDVAFLNKGTEKEILIGARGVIVIDSTVNPEKRGESFNAWATAGPRSEEKFIRSPKIIKPNNIFYTEITFSINSTGIRKIYERNFSGRYDEIAIGLLIKIGHKGKDIIHRNITIGSVGVHEDGVGGGVYGMAFDLLSNKVVEFDGHIYIDGREFVPKLN